MTEFRITTDLLWQILKSNKYFLKKLGVIGQVCCSLIIAFQNKSGSKKLEGYNCV
jgi:hypothetical protein